MSSVLFNRLQETKNSVLQALKTKSKHQLLHPYLDIPLYLQIHFSQGTLLLLYTTLDTNATDLLYHFLSRK